MRYPLGEDVVGYLGYTPGEHMAVSLMRVSGAAFAGDDLLGGTPDERTAAAGFVSSGGRYALWDGAVIHHVELNLFPNWVGVG